MRRPANVLVFFVLLLGCACVSAHADQGMAAQGVAAVSEMALFEEIPMVSLATRTEQPINEAPAAMSIITSDEIARSGYTNVIDLLRSQVGLNIFQTNANFSTVTTRGMTDTEVDKIQVLVDGRSVFDPINGSMFWTDNIIFIEDIDHIEIVRGSNSVLFGYNAFNGIINIVTKDPKKTQGLLTKVTVGTQSTQQYFSRFGATAGKLDLRVSWEKYHSQGSGDDEGHETRDAWRLNAGNLRGRYTVSDDINFEFFGGEKQGVYGSQESGNFGDFRLISRYAQLKYNQKLSEDSNLHLQTFGEGVFKQDLNFATKSDPQNENDAAWKSYDFEFSHDFKAGEKNAFVWGAGWRRYQGRLDILKAPTNFYHDTIMRVFANDAITLTDKLMWYCGGEYAENSFTGHNWSTRQTLMYQFIKGHFLRATYALNYHAYGFMKNLIAIGPLYRPADDLKSEQVKAYELGYRGSYLDDKLSVNVEVYQNEVDNIPSLGLDEAPSRFYNSNAAKIYGAETGLEYKPFNWLKTYLNHTYIVVDDQEDEWRNADPRHRINVGGCIFMKKRYLPDYFDARFTYSEPIALAPQLATTGITHYAPYWTKLDVTIGKKLNKNTEVQLAILNALEPTHHEYHDTVDVNRQILGSVKIQF
jgi:iron complex outermembrane recepter protein